MQLKPAIVQDAESGSVLMLAWMDVEAERRTRETGEAWFWSRSRRELWHKGATSGNTLAVEEIRDDCDGDALLVRVRPAGPACHMGSESCFAPWLWRVVAERAQSRPPGSYVASLLEEGVAADCGDLVAGLEHVQRHAAASPVDVARGEFRFPFDNQRGGIVRAHLRGERPAAPVALLP